MKTITLISIIFLLNQAYGQGENRFVIRGAKCYYNNFKDTIVFSKIEKGFYKYSYSHDTINTEDHVTIFNRLEPPYPLGAFFEDSLVTIDSIQIDGKGAKEIIFYRKIIGAGSIDMNTYVERTKYQLVKVEIWNIDTKELYWDEVISCKNNYLRDDSYGRPYNETYGTDFFEFKLHFGKTGNITIQKVLISVYAFGKTETKDEPLNYQICPKITEGVYDFVGGKYTKIE